MQIQSDDTLLVESSERECAVFWTSARHAGCFCLIVTVGAEYEEKRPEIRTQDQQKKILQGRFNHHHRLQYTDKS